MENLIELIIAIVVIVASTLWDKGKGTSTGSTGDEATDLAAIEEFFKKQNQGKASGPVPPPPPPPPLQEHAPTWDAGSVGPQMRKTPAAQPARQAAKKKKEKKPVQPSPHQANAPFGGECLDEGPTFDQMGFSQKGLISSTPTTARPRAEKAFARSKWDRKRLLDAFVMNEVMNRYNIMRIFERIPGRRID